MYCVQRDKSWWPIQGESPTESSEKTLDKKWVTYKDQQICAVEECPGDPLEAVGAAIGAHFEEVKVCCQLADYSNTTVFVYPPNIPQASNENEWIV